MLYMLALNVTMQPSLGLSTVPRTSLAYVQCRMYGNRPRASGILTTS